MRNVPERDIPPESRFDVINPLGSPDWEEFVSQQAGACPFHGTAWARLLTETYGFPLTYVVERRNGRIVAGLPLAETGGGLRPRRGVSLPFSDSCPPLGCVPSVTPTESAPTSHDVGPGPDHPSPTFEASARRDALLARVLQLASERGWKTVEFREATAWTGIHPASVQFYGHRIPLAGGREAVLHRCSSSVSRALRKAGRSELVTRRGTGEDLMREYFALHCLTRRRHGLPPQPWAFFHHLQRLVLSAGGGFAVITAKDSQPIAGAVFLVQGRDALYKFGASDETFQALRPNNQVFWEAIGHCIDLGCNYLDLGRTSLEGEGLRRFKLGWGSEERVVPYLRVDLRTRQVEPTPDRATGWHTAVFRALPVPVSALIGRVAYRFAA